MAVRTDLKVSSYPNIALLAKSFEGSNEGCAGLQFHLQCTWYAAKLILAQTAVAQLESLGLDPNVYRERFERLVLLAAATHDLGKANTHFQEMVRRRRRGNAQALRHEWVSYLLLRATPMGEWLKGTFERHPHDFDYLVWAVTGHHRKVLDKATNDSSGMKLLAKDPDFQKCVDWIADACRLPKPNFDLATLENMPWSAEVSRRRGRTEETLSEVCKKDGKTLSGYLEKCISTYDEADDDDDGFDSMGTAKSADQRLRQDEHRLMAAARSTLMAADVVASAAAGKIPVSSKDADKSKESNGTNDGCDATVAVDKQDGQGNTNLDKRDEQQHVLERMIAWISGAMDSNHTDVQNLDAKDIAAEDHRKVGTLADLPNQKFYDNVIKKKKGEFRGEIHSIAESQANAEMSQQRQEFQENVAHSNSRVTLVSAGCGSGKTLAAYMWAANQCPDTGARLCFCYPTTGTATEGYMDYLLGEGDEWGKLIHSRSDADYQIFERLQQVRQDNEDPELLSVMRSLHFWTGKIICCTVDTVLGFLVNTYSGHLAWAALAQSMFVFDEIHSYDERLFGWLLEFLKTMRGSKILLMTASLPAHRLKAIEKVLAAQNETLGIVNGPKAWEEVKRYQRYTPAKSTVNTSATALAESHGTLCSPELAVQEAIASYQRGEKVLYICNTVDRAIETATQIHEQMKRMNLVGDDTTASTCYGFLLSLVGEVDRNVHRGACVTIARCNQPERSVILRTKWRIKDSKLDPGVGCNRTPDYQQLLTDCRLVIWLDSTEEDNRPDGVLPLEERVRLALDRSTCGQIERFGGLSLGESTHLVNDISLLDPQNWSANETVSMFSDDVNDSKGEFQAEIFLTVDVANMEKDVNLLTLPVWVDHVGSSGTRYVIGQFKPYTVPPQPTEMPKIVPP